MWRESPLEICPAPQNNHLQSSEEGMSKIQKDVHENVT